MDRTDFEHWSSRDVARLLALVEGERRYYQDMVAALPVAVAALAADRSIISSNHAFRQLLGVQIADLRGKRIEQILPSAVLVEKIRDLTVNGIPQPGFLLRLERKRLRVSLVPVRNQDGETETLLVAADVAGADSGESAVTPATPMAAESPSGMVRAEADSAAPAASATPNKQQERQRITAERNAALRGLCGRLAHDLNNPLMLITGYAEELLHGLEPGDARRADVEQILEAAQRVGHITEQLLQFTRKCANAPQPVELRALLSGMKDRIAGAAGHGVALDLALATPVWAMCDPEQMEQIVLALVSPAREGAQNRTRLHMSCDTATIADLPEDGSPLQPGMYARLTVRDNGQGVDAGKQRAVFEAVVNTGPQAGQGSVSAALARAYARVREWGGDIGFHSEPSRGSTFVVYLPVATTGPAAAQLALPETEPARETILVVDDEPGIRGLVAKILRRERYRVLEAASAAEAVSVAATHRAPIHMLLTDITMPGRSGRELAGQFRQSMPHLKVLFMSGFTGGEPARTGEFGGSSRFLQKPFTLDALVGTVRELLDS